MGWLDDISATARFMHSQNIKEISSETWNYSINHLHGLSSIQKRQVLRGLNMLVLFCLHGIEFNLQECINFNCRIKLSPFFTSTNLYKQLMEAGEQLKQIYGVQYKNQFYPVLKRLMAFADRNEIRELSPKLLNFLQEPCSEDYKRKQKTIIYFLDKYFNLHWEKPGTSLPFHYLSLPSRDQAELYFKNLKHDAVVKLDMLIVKSILELKEYGLCQKYIAIFIKHFHRFHWFCFKRGESSYKSELYEQYRDFEVSNMDSTKLRNAESNLRCAGIVLSAVKAQRKLPHDIFAKQKKKLADQGLENIRIELSEYYEKEKQLSKNSTAQYVMVFKLILRSCSIKDPTELLSFNDANLETVLNYFSTHFKISTRASKLPILQSILTWLYERHYVQKNFALGVITPRYIKTYNPPYLTLADQARLEEHIKTESWLCRVVILLALHTGLRESDIRNLRKDDLDFRHKTLSIIQVKTKTPLTVPIYNDIIEAIKNYLKTERPKRYKKGEPLLLTIKPPFKPYTSLYGVVSGVIKRSGLISENSDAKGTHMLRYSLVHALLSSMVEHKVITDTLGHTSEQSDRPYLSMSDDMLRLCALDLSLIGKGALSVAGGK